MSITFPISFPSVPGPRTVEWRMVSAVASVRSPFTLQLQVQAHQGQSLGVRVTLPRMIETRAEEWIASLLSLNGMEGTVLFGDPVRKTPRGSALGVPLVMGASQTGQALITDGWTASAANVLLPGDWIQLGTTGLTQRIYRVLKAVTANGSGQATIDIWPRLRASPADNEPLVLSNTKGLFRLADNAMDWNVLVTKYYEFEFDLMEAI